MRERWFGATGRRVLEIVVEGEHDIPLDDALVVDGVDDVGRLEVAGDDRVGGGFSHI